MSLFQLIHPDDVEILRMYILGGYWTYGSIIDVSQTMAVRLAPHSSRSGTRQPSPDGTFSPERDIWLQLVGLDPVRRRAVFAGDRY